MDDAKLAKELYTIQKENNCLIVMDDIRTIDNWRSLKSAFPVGETMNARKILLTTRGEMVSNVGSLYKIQGLTKEEGWKLLYKKAGISDLSEKLVTSQMERIGMNLVKRCKANGEGLTNDDIYYTVTQVLGLSYDSLPPRLAQYFLCFGNYEEGEEIGTEELYMFWIAECLISVEDKAAGELMLDVAEHYLDELAHRSLVQVESHKVKGASWSKYRTCRVHDLIRDVCLSKLKKEKVINIVHLPWKPDHEFKASIVRRLCIHLDDDGDESMLNPYDQHVISHIRSLLVLNRAFETVRVWLDKILSLEKFKLLRVLTVSRYKFTRQDIRSISELVYLKCLCLHYCMFEELPSSVDNLRNLKTLDLRSCYPIIVPN